MSQRQHISSGAPWEATALVHNEVFGHFRPVTTIEVSVLINPAFLVETEADALITDSH